jgi:glycosyltransferase involved in cell wall biosynthesis
MDFGIQFLWPQLHALQVDGFEVHALCGDGPLVPHFEAAGVTIHTITVQRKISPLADLRLLGRLAALMRREQYTIVHTHTAKLELIGQLAARLAGVPIVVYTNHGFYFRSQQLRRFRRWFLIQMARIAGKISDHILSQSSEDIATALELGLYRSERLSYLGNGIDISRFNAHRFTQEQIHAKKQEIGIPAHHRVVGMVGRYVWEKGYREFFEAAKLVVDAHKDVSFITVGVALASERDPVDFDLLKQLEIADRVVVLEARRDMPDLYAVMDVVVLPSYREGFPRTLMEAAAMGKPTVASDIPGCREAVINEYNGFLIPPRDSVTLAQEIEHVLVDPVLATKLGHNGRALAEERFDEMKVVERLQECYRTLLRQKFPTFAPDMLTKDAR